MKSIVTLSLLLTLSFAAQAQNIAINETGIEPDTSAMLDISSTTRGLLMPRMTKAQKNAIALPAEGLLLYQTGPDSIGFHYYNGTQWQWLAGSGAPAGWLTTGNAGTDSTLHFLGTTDNKPIMLRQNNLPVGQLNTSTNNFFIGGGSGVNASGKRNTGFGDSTLNNITSGTDNTGLGYRALKGSAAVTGIHNTAAGSNALATFETGSHNTAVGGNSLSLLKDGMYNVAIGSHSMEVTKKGIGNIAIGTSALRYADSANYNVAVGHDALYVNDSSRNVAVGYNALLFNNRNSNVAVGFRAGYFNSYLQSNSQLGVENTYMGFQAGYYANTGSKNVAIGTNALMGAGYYNSDVPANTAYKRNIAIGDSALNFTIGSDNVAIGFKALAKADNSTRHMAIGNWALQNTTAGYPNTAIGYLSQDSNTTGGANTSLGAYSLSKNTTGINNTAIGNAAMHEAANELNPAQMFDNTAVGNDALRLTRYWGQTAIGAGALRNDTSGLYNTAVGYLSMYNHKRGNSNTALGTSALRNDITGAWNTALGVNAMFNHKHGNNNVAIGVEALFNDTSGYNNVALGTWSMFNHLRNNNNTAVGFESMFFDQTGEANTAMGWRSLRYAKNPDQNTAIGVGALEFTDSSMYNVAIGRGAMMGKGGRHNTAIGFYASGAQAGLPTTNLYVNETTSIGYIAGYKNMGERNTFVGAGAGYGASADSLTGIENTGIGAYTMYYTTTGRSNTTLGIGSLFSNTTGTGNVAVGTRALGYSNVYNYNIAVGDSALFTNNADGNLAVGTFTLRNNNTGAYNTATGNYALLNNTNGHRNVALGDSALSANTTGSTNTAIGYLANTSAANLTNATAIGANALVAQNNSLVLGSINGVNGASASTRVGIGTTTPDSSLSVANKFSVGSSGTVQYDNSVPVMNYMFKSGDANANRMVLAHSPGYPTWGLQYLDASDKFSFLGNSNNVLTVDLYNQRTGMNTINPDSTLSVANKFSVGSSGTVQYDNSVTVMNYLFKSGSSNANRMLFAHSPAYPNYGLQYQDNTDRFAFLSAGNSVMTVDLNSYRVGIGVAAPTYQLHLSGDGAAKLTTSTWSTTSDVRLKTIDGPYKRGLKEILQLNTIMYHYAKGNKRKLSHIPQAYGFSAQEVQKIFPEAVTEEEDGYLSFNIHPILVAYVNAFKEQQQLIEKLQTEAEQEKKDNAALLKQLLQRIEALEGKKAGAK
ncbi:MAG TPA: tail fiber domain-containing protein [Ferruginibacter sp.]|nr:tail fiber domain-containing protein [Ferruginibacter sp.]HMP20367.1 tail fiber domain-containing protein [Ferruginibacter sp.]